MILEFIVVVAVAAAVIAIAKHGSVSLALASAKREAALIEAQIVKVEGEAKTVLAGIAARLRAL